MKTVVIYHSQTGFTEKYAKWIAEAANADCFPLTEAKKKDMSVYDAIIYGGFACAGTISKLNWFKGNIDSWTGKKLIAFCVGASPLENPEIEPTLRRNFTDAEFQKVSVFYCPGGFNYERMSAPTKLVMKMFIAALKAKKNKTEMEEKMVDVISSSYDISDKKYISPILKCLEEPTTA